MLSGEAVLVKTAYVEVGRGEEGTLLVVLACPDHSGAVTVSPDGAGEALARGWDTHDLHCL